ncbi:hypothetical protein BCO37747_04777 [Burkholderia contaminans]|nr:hypothetical protein BCO37747_04777 [Burkholderia contaminans]
MRLGRYLDQPAQWLGRLNAQNGSPRQQRSERRVACVQLARAMIKFCDLATLRIGVPGANGWVDFTLSYLAEQAGLPLRRAERALRDLAGAKLVKLRRQCEVQESDQGVRYKGIAAIRYIAPVLFEAFGLGRWLRHERTRALLRAQRRVSKQRKHDRKASEIATVLTDKIAAIQARSRQSADNGTSQAEYDRALVLRAGQIKAEHPEWGRDACYAAARQQLAPPG